MVEGDPGKSPLSAQHRGGSQAAGNTGDVPGPRSLQDTILEY